MEVEPKIEVLGERPYLAIPQKLQMCDVPAVLPPLIPEIIDWANQQGLKPAGPPFFHYSSMEDGLVDIEVGIPVADLSGAGTSLKKAVSKNPRVKIGTFPAGPYLTSTYLGPYNQLNRVHRALDAWGNEKGLQFKGPRTEFYPSDPKLEPDPQKWRTDIEMPLA